MKNIPNSYDQHHEGRLTLEGEGTSRRKPTWAQQLGGLTSSITSRSLYRTERGRMSRSTLPRSGPSSCTRRMMPCKFRGPPPHQHLYSPADAQQG